MGQKNYVEMQGIIQGTPVVRYSAKGTCFANFTLGIENKDGKLACFPRCVAFNEPAQLLEREGKDGSEATLTGHIQTGSYTGKDGRKVYTTQVVADKLELAESKYHKDDIPDGFAKLDVDVPFE